MRPASAREVALRVLRRVRTADAYANLVLPGEIARAGLGPRDAALATELAYGTLRMQGTLDWVVGLFSSRPPLELDPDALDALRLGAYQLLFTDVPDYAAVAATVACVRGRRWAGFVNAVLRTLARERERIPWPQREGDLLSYLQIRYAHPAWLVRRWVEELGPEDAEALCRADNEAPGVGVRVNTARIAPQDLAERFRRAGLEVERGRFAPEALLVRGGGHPAAWPGYAEGLFAVQDEASVLVGQAVAEDDPATVVDLCAGPGGKTAHLAGQGRQVVAVELRRERARLVLEALGRLGGRAVVVQGDGRAPPVRPGVDAVLVDAPCSGLGVLRRRPEARWRVRPQDVDRCARLQLELLGAGFRLLRPTGTLVYAVCTVTRAETTGVLSAFLDSEPGAELVEVLPSVPRAHGRREPTLQLLPHVHGTDGMFVAKLRRAP